MSKIGEYRLKVYELLFDKPICNYAETVGKRKELNVLILGSGWAGNEAFKASFWAGQYINSDLKITVASKNALEYQKQVLSSEDDAALPALSLFAEKKKYADLSFKNIFVSNDSLGFASLDIGNKKYNYIIVSLGDAEHNWLATSELITQIRNAKVEGTVFYNGKIIINVFNEFSDDIDPTDQKSLIAEGKQNGIEVNFFGSETETSGRLEEIARNINFSYEMKYDQRSGKIQADEKFDKSKDYEFAQSPHDYEVGDMRIVSNFIGSEYTSDSSFASAVHIPYKLAACNEYNADEEAIEVLKGAIRTKNALYKKLVALEHRRWNAYMVMRGYRAPTEKEEEGVLYHGINTHQDKDKLIHICLCDCGEKGTALENDFNRQYHLWLEKKCPKNSPSELDRASLRCHQLTSKLTKRLNPQTVFDHILGDSAEYVNYRKSINKLFNDEENSLTVYSQAFEDATAYAASISQEELEQVKTADRMLSVVKARNLRMDFLSLDAQLVEMIPFSLWYGVKYKNVLTISDGIATQDVVVPTLFSAQNALFIGSNVEDEKYKNSIISYFSNRGSATLPRFITMSSINVQNIMDCIEGFIEEQELDNIIINYVPHKSAEVSIALGCLIERYNGKINIAQYDVKKGIISFSGERNIGVGLGVKSFSVNEFISLMGGKITNELSVLYDSTQYDSLCELFHMYSDTRCYKNSSGGMTPYIPWNAMATFFAQSAKDDDSMDRLLCQALTNSETFHYEGVFTIDIFDHCVIDSTLKKLQDYRIISNYHERRSATSAFVEFKYYDYLLPKLLKPFELESINSERELFAAKHKQLKFIPMAGIKVSNFYVDNKKLYGDNEHQSLVDAKISFLEQLQARGFIEGLELGDEGTVTFAFKDEPTMSLLKKQGNTFELVVYHLLRESGMFDDIETGTKIAWDANEVNLDQVLFDLLNSSEGAAFGYKHYAKVRSDVLYGSVQKSSENELDVIAIKGMTPIFISCKTGKDNKIEWLYEIASLSSHFMSSGVMAISNDLSRQSKSAFVERANQMGVPILGADTLWDEDKLFYALRTIL